MDENQEQKTPEAQEAPEVSETEQQAMSLGWKPEEEFKADNPNKKWRTAEDFMDRKSLFDKIDDQHRKIRDLERGMKSFAEHNAKVEQMAYDRAVKDLKAQKKEALAEGDLVKAETIQDQIETVGTQKVIAQQQFAQAQTQPVAPEFQAWLVANDWYEKDPDLRAYADGVGNQLASSGLQGPELLRQVSEKTRAFAGHRIQALNRNPNKDRAVPAESGVRKTSVKTSASLSPDEERIMNNMIRAGAPITREDYIKQLRG